MNEVSRSLKLFSARGALLLGVALAGAAAAAAEPTEPMAVHPLEIADATGEDSAKLQRLFGPIVAAQPIKTIAPSVVRELLRKRGTASCATAQEPARCLGELAQTAGARSALLVTLAAYSGPRLILSGLLVRADGTTERPPPREYARGSGAALETSVKEALTDFLKKSVLELESPGLAPLVVPVDPPPVVPEPEPVPGPAVAPGGMDNRLLPRLGLGVGAAVVGAAVIVELNAASTGREWNGLPNGAPHTAAEAEAALRVKERFEAQQTAGAVLVVTGAALLVASGAVLLFATDAPGSGASHAELVVYPGGVALGGGF
ncbi:MAG: hypothetical protein ACYC8T_19730 [Myxococcaceae bacterium]